MMNESVRIERERRKTAALHHRQEIQKMLIDRVLTPNVIRMGLMMGIIAYSTYCARSKNNVGPVQSAVAMALPGIGIPMLAADAGITDWRALAAISATGTGYVTGQMTLGWMDNGVIPSVPDVIGQLAGAATSWADPLHW